MTNAVDRRPVRDAAEAEVDRRFMAAAIDVAKRALAAGEPPIGACLVRDGRIVACTHNSVIGSLDVTAHAEVQAIRRACREERTLELSGCRLFVTVEPCPMCLAACHYAHISEIVFGAKLDDIQQVTGDELILPRLAGADARGFGVRLRGGLLADECRALLSAWARNR